MTIVLTQAHDCNLAAQQKLQTRFFGDLPRKRMTGQVSYLFNQIINR